MSDLSKTNILLRTLSLPLGVVFIWYGVITFATPLSDDVIEIINSSCAVVMGLYFIIYAVTGRGNIRSSSNNSKN